MSAPLPVPLDAAAAPVAGLMAAAAVALAAQALAAAWRRGRAGLTRRARAALADLNLPADPARLIAIGLPAALAFGAIGAALTASWGPPLVAAAALVGPAWALRLARRRRRQRIAQQLPDALVMMAASLRAGASTHGAFELLVREVGGPLAEELALVLREQRLGTPVHAGFDALSARLAIEDLALWSTAVGLAHGVGGNLAEVLERLAATLRAKSALEGKIDALTAQGRLQGVIVGLLPPGLGVVLWFLDPEAMRPLVHTGAGQLALGVVVGLELLGAWMIRRIVRIEI